MKNKKPEAGYYSPDKYGWTVVLDHNNEYSTKSQDTVEILSQLMQIKKMLRRRK